MPRFPSLWVTGIVAIVCHALPARSADDISLSFDLAPPVMPPQDPSSAWADQRTTDKTLMSPLDTSTGLGTVAVAPRTSTGLGAGLEEGSNAGDRASSANPTPDVVPGAWQQPVSIAQISVAWWSQGSDSPLAVAIGSAEGTRQPDGTKNAAYYWHTDPGNGSDNFGTFSYQHLQPQEKAAVVAQSTSAEKRQMSAQQKLPELADTRQLKRLQQFHDRLRQQAQAKGITLSEVELINGLDLANQSEAAALEDWGYLDRLAQMRELIPNDSAEQIREARTWAYWDPQRQGWDAPGLGNTYSTIRQDQERRFNAIEVALQQQRQQQSLPSAQSRHYQQQQQQQQQRQPQGTQPQPRQGLGLEQQAWNEVQQPERQAFNEIQLQPQPQLESESHLDLSISPQESIALDIIFTEPEEWRS